MKKNITIEKINLFYGFCDNGTVDISVDNIGNYNYFSLDCVKKDYPDNIYNYIEVKGDAK